MMLTPEQLEYLRGMRFEASRGGLSVGSDAIVSHIDAQQARISELERDRDHWKANHDNQVRRARILMERTDMPMERVKAYQHMQELEEQNARLLSLLADIRIACGDHGKRMQDELVAYVRDVAQDAARYRWIDPNDKTQKQYLPWIGEAVLFCHGGVTYYGQHNGGSFQSGQGVTTRRFNTWECRWMYPPAAQKPEGEA